MVLIVEYRIPLPFSVDEFERGFRYALAKVGKEQTTGGQGVEVLSSHSYYDETNGAGVYAHALYRFGDRLPKWLGKVAPPTALMVEEKTWNSYPVTKTVITNPFFSKLEVITTTKNIDNELNLDNVHNLTKEQLQMRKVVVIDIAKDEVAKRDYRADRDPALYQSKLTGRGPLLPGWQQSMKPMMCSYKLVVAKADYWGIQSKVESLMHKGHYELFVLNHKTAFCLMDEWLPMTLDDVQRFEESGRTKFESNAVQSTQISSVQAADGDSEEEEEEFIDAVEYLGEDQSPRTIPDQPMFATAMAAASSSMHPGNDVYQNLCPVCVVQEGSIPFPAEIMCENCNEMFCQKHFQMWHTTANMAAHKSYPLSAKPAMQQQNIEPIQQHQIQQLQQLQLNPGSTSNACLLSIAMIEKSLELLKRYNEGVVYESLHNTASKHCRWSFQGCQCSPALRVGSLTAVDWITLRQDKGLTELSSMIDQLQGADVPLLDHEQRLTFWLNAYNALTFHAHVIKGGPPNGLVARRRFSQSSYKVSGFDFNLIEIEHSIIRCHSRPPDLIGSSVFLSSKYHGRDPRRQLALEKWEPLITFALSAATNSAPPIQVFQPSVVHTQLAACTHWYLEHFVTVDDRKRHVTVPKMLSWWVHEFGSKWREVLHFVINFVSPEKRDDITAASVRPMRKVIREAPYDWQPSFSYFAPSN